MNLMNWVFYDHDTGHLLFQSIFSVILSSEQPWKTEIAPLSGAKNRQLLSVHYKGFAFPKLRVPFL
jgi:hypothetical protein